MLISYLCMWERYKIFLAYFIVLELNLSTFFFCFRLMLFMKTRSFQLAHRIQDFGLVFKHIIKTESFLYFLYPEQEIKYIVNQKIGPAIKGLRDAINMRYIFEMSTIYDGSRTFDQRSFNTILWIFFAISSEVTSRMFVLASPIQCFIPVNKRTDFPRIDRFLKRV